VEVDLKQSMVLISLTIMVLFVSCSTDNGDNSIYGKTDNSASNDENNVTDGNNTVSDNGNTPDNAGLPDDSGLPDNEENDSSNTGNDADLILPDDNQIPDNDYISGLCGNGELEGGEFCELEMMKLCVDIDSGSFTGGNAPCNSACTGWDTSQCESLSCDDATDNPDVAFVDSNCDGIDGTIADSIFVDILKGNDFNSGTKDNPLSSIAKGLELAQTDGKKQVLIAAGIYNETIHLIDGISIHGAYSGFPEWKRALANEVLIIGGPVGMIGDSVSNLTLSFIRIKSADNFTESGTSAGMRLKDCAKVQLRYVKIESGHGGDGSAGSAGTEGSSGLSGGYGNLGCEDDGGFCGSCDRPSGGTGGSSSCGAKGGNGGQSGNGSSNGDSGQNGEGSTDNGGAGGTSTSSGSCPFVPGASTNGKDGGNGIPGTKGAAGASFGGYDESGYVPGNGGNGDYGINGNGGGGGGGGHGGNDGSLKDCDTYGSSGGGGGGGGCGGTGGTGGTGGGASIGIWIENSTLIILDDVGIDTNDGGAGGAGGKGGKGGAGGLAGSGGGYGGSQADGGCGGYGGAGGTGGVGGAGGGGGGGPSMGIVKIESTVDGIMDTVFFIGQGGPGGASDGNYGLPGKVGSVKVFPE